MQRSVDAPIKIHRKNNAFNTISEIKSMYQPFITMKAPLAHHRLKTKLDTLESSPSETLDNFAVDSCANSEKTDSVIYSKAWGETKPPIDADVSTDSQSLNNVLTTTQDSVLNDNAVTAAESALVASAPVVIKAILLIYLSLVMLPSTRKPSPISVNQLIMRISELILMFM